MARLGTAVVNRRRRWLVDFELVGHGRGHRRGLPAVHGIKVITAQPLAVVGQGALSLAVHAVIDRGDAAPGTEGDLAVLQ